MTRSLALLLAGTLVVSARAVSQEPRLTVEEIFGQGAFGARLEAVRWSRDPATYTLVSRDSAGRAGIDRVDAASGRREPLVAASDLTSPDGRPLDVDSYEISPDGELVLLATEAVGIHHHTRAKFFLWSRRDRRLTPLSARPGLQEHAKFSPDGRAVGFVRENNIFVRDLASGTERQLTADGSADILNGIMDWVYEEEFFFSDGFRFSPDGKRIAFWRMDQTAIKPFFMMNDRPLYPEVVPVRYPKVGTANSIVRLGVVELASGATTWLDVGAEKDIYVPAAGFSGSSSEVWFTRVNRLQNRLELLLADVASGRSRVVLTDTSSTWIDPVQPIWLDNGSAFLFLSERDGYRRLFVSDREGARPRKLTTEPWDVMEVYAVDERARVVYFTGAADGPVNLPLYRIGLDGKGFAKVTADSGTHRIIFNADRTLFVDEYSRFAVPPVQSLRRADGSLVRVLSPNSELAERAQRAGLRAPEFIRVPGADGTMLNGYIIRPPGLEASRRYPLLIYVYGGPGSQTVRDRWDGQRMPWHQLLAQSGYIVASIDGRGTNGRGTEFRKSVYLKMGWEEKSDQIAAAKHLGSLPYVDPARIGIWGWSYGGFVSLLASMTSENLFKAAISVASVSDQRFYDTIYAERFMRTPAENEEGYRKVAPLTYAADVKTRLLIVHGMWDDNVQFQNAVLLIDKLAAANRKFDMRLYPFKNHGIPGSAVRVNLYTAMTEWLKQNL